MALFKISKGLQANLPTTKTSGHCWYTTDNSMFYVDYEDENGEVQRRALNAKDAETLTGASLSTILNSSDIEIPTSKSILTELQKYSTIEYVDEAIAAIPTPDVSGQIEAHVASHHMTEEETIELLMDMDVVQPLSNANNSVYTDNNNKLYVL